MGEKVVRIQVGISTTKLELFVAGFIKTGKVLKDMQR